MPEPRRIEYLPLDDIQGHPENPKDHDLDLLDESFDRFDFTEPVVLDERTGLLAAGHGRIERLRQRRDAGDPAPEGVVVAGDGVWLVPVVRGWASKDDDEARAYLVASNAMVLRGGWDTARLAGALDRVASETASALRATGFDDVDLDDLWAELEESAEEALQGASPEQPFTPKQVRSLVLEFPLDLYERVVTQAKALREERGVGSNAELLEALLREWVEEVPA